MTFKNQFGLTNPTSRDIVSENCMPTTVQHHNILVALKGFDNEVGMKLRSDMIEYIHSCKTKKDGLYNQYPQWYMNQDTFSNPKDKWTSKEQLQAMGCMLAMNGNYYLVYEMNRYLRSHLNCYNNRRKFFSWPRWMGLQTRYLFDVLVSGMNYNSWNKLIGICEDQLIGDKEDPDRSTGALKAFTIISSMLIVQGCYHLLKDLIKESKSEIIEFYKESDHPIRILLEEFE